MAVNLLYSNERVDELADELAEVDADVIVFSEYTIEHETTLLAHPLAVRYPHQVNRDGLYAGGMAVWSKYPVTENERIDTTNYTVDAVAGGPRRADPRPRRAPAHPDLRPRRLDPRPRPHRRTRPRRRTSRRW